MNSDFLDSDDTYQEWFDRYILSPIRDGEIRQILPKPGYANSDEFIFNRQLAAMISWRPVLSLTEYMHSLSFGDCAALINIFNATSEGNKIPYEITSITLYLLQLVSMEQHCMIDLVGDSNVLEDEFVYLATRFETMLGYRILQIRENFDMTYTFFPDDESENDYVKKYIRMAESRESKK